MAAPVTIITGAGSGIGRALAQALAARGHRLLLVGRRPAMLLETSLRCEGSPDVFCHSADICDESAAAAIVDAAIGRFGRIDNLVNCAGIAPKKSIDKTTAHDLHACFAVHAIGPALLIINCWRHFADQRSGRIVNVSSLAASDPFDGFLAYAASKSALDSLTRSTDREGAPLGIKAFSINLGCVETAMLRSFADETLVPSAKTLSPDFVASQITPYLDGSRDRDHGRCIALASP